MKARGIRVSLFVDPDAEAIRAGQRRRRRPRGALYRAVRSAHSNAVDPTPNGRSAVHGAAREAHARGLGVNAGHDLDLDNLVLFRTLPHLDEVSIGHAIISRALFVGLDTVVREYLAVLA